MNKQTELNYKLWRVRRLEDEDLNRELASIEGDEDAINDRFYRELEFGTGGLRGLIGVGTNRINIYTVAKATKGYGRYLLSETKNPSVAIAYDSRIKSELFAKTAASVLASMGIRVYIWKELMPTPSLSFAVRHYHCDGGIVITASHNPSSYNGYKVYGSDGCQITSAVADLVLKEIFAVDVFEDFKIESYEKALEKGEITLIGEDVFDLYIEAVSSQSLASGDMDKSFKIAYTPLYGAGLRSVTECLRRNGFSDIELVKEQSEPNGNFPTCPYPNPEIREALEEGLKVARKSGAELLMATDPDCDRLGIAIRDGEDYTLIGGNEIGILLLDYICSQRIKQGKMPANPIAIKTIVSTEMAEYIAEDYGIELVNVLTGFKYIGEQIRMLEEKGEERRFILGFEESYGYLTGTYVRDKDGVNASLMVAEMFAYYKTQNRSLLDVLEELYSKYGYFLTSLHSLECKGESGMHKMNSIMQGLREHTLTSFAGKKVIKVSDYLLSEEKDPKTQEKKRILLPKSNVIKLILEDRSSVVFRPSGTEPKLKIYIGVSAKNKVEAKEIEARLYEEAKRIIE